MMPSVGDRQSFKLVENSLSCPGPRRLGVFSLEMEHRKLQIHFRVGRVCTNLWDVLNIMALLLYDEVDALA